MRQPKQARALRHKAFPLFHAVYITQLVRYFHLGLLGRSNDGDDDGRRRHQKAQNTSLGLALPLFLALNLIRPVLFKCTESIIQLDTSHNNAAASFSFAAQSTLLHSFIHHTVLNHGSQQSLIYAVCKSFNFSVARFFHYIAHNVAQVCLFLAARLWSIFQLKTIIYDVGGVRMQLCE